MPSLSGRRRGKERPISEFPMPFGKHRGKTINEIMEKDPTYLAWFVDNIKGRDDLVAQIKTHTRFAEAWEEYLANPKVPKQQRKHGNGTKGSSRSRRLTSYSMRSSREWHPADALGRG